MAKRQKRAYLKKRTHSYMKGGIKFFHANVARHATHEVPQSKSFTLGQKEINQSLQVEELYQSDFWQGIDRFNRVLMVDLVGKHRIYRYFSGNRNFFLKENLVLGVTQRSFEYKDKEQALRYYGLGLITWVESIQTTFPLRSPSPSP
jgi:hypothetical protein